jgi:hypothetical protein
MSPNNKNKHIEEKKTEEPNYGYDRKIWYYDAEQGRKRRITPKTKKLYIRLMFRIYLAAEFVIEIFRLIRDAYNWFLCAYHGTLTKKQKINYSAQNYFFVVFILTPMLMTFWNIYW